jgi:hypothetical protein
VNQTEMLHQMCHEVLAEVDIRGIISKAVYSGVYGCGQFGSSFSVQYGAVSQLNPCTCASAETRRRAPKLSGALCIT